MSEALGEEVGFRPLLKVETLNPVRCFKGRGGSVLAAQAAPGDVLACASAGNFGQGVAYGARAAGLRCVVYASDAAQPDKLARMRALGADVRLVAGDFDAAKDAAEAAAAEEGMRSIVDGREPESALGAGTIARELTAWPEPIDAVVIPVGNGSLAWGMTTWLAAHSPETELIGVGPTGAPMMEHAWRTGSSSPSGQQTRSPMGSRRGCPSPRPSRRCGARCTASCSSTTTAWATPWPCSPTAAA